MIFNFVTVNEILSKSDKNGINRSYMWESQEFLLCMNDQKQSLINQ